MSDTAQNDRSKYIRTYAKDVAALTGTKAPAAPTKPAPPPAPLTPPAPPPPPPIDVPRGTQEVAAVYNAPEKTESRDEILARLKRKLNASAHLEIADTPPPVPEPAPAPVPPPIFERPEPPPPPMPPIQKEEATEPARLHTFKSDFADHIDERHASTFSVLAAQEDAKRKPAAPGGGKRKSTALAIASLFLVFLGVAGATSAYWYFATSHIVPVAAPSVPSLVFSDEQMELTGTAGTLMQALSDAANQPLVEGNVLVTYISESTTTPKGKQVKTPLAGGALIRALELPAPSILLRNIAPESTVGVISAGKEVRPFFVFRITSYERTFAGMLAWESTMGDDLALLYPPYGMPSINPDATSIHLGTSTPSQQAAPSVLPAFSDEVVNSHDVRVLKDTAGDTVMLYGYADKETLILARDEAAFSALLTRLRAAGK